MHSLIDLDRYPLDRLDAPEGRALLTACRKSLARDGMFSLEGLVRRQALQAAVSILARDMANRGYTHKRRHNIYFDPDLPGLAEGHPALREVETVNHTLCADQLADGLLTRLYEWPPLARFLAAALDKDRLHTMADPLARVNVMAYGEGEALNWHFDRSEFTTTLLLQRPEGGGVFQYRCGLRSDDDPNYDGVADLLNDRDPAIREQDAEPGTLTVFKGRNTAHRVTPVVGAKPRLIAVYSYYDRPDVSFSPAERSGFYGREM